MSARRNRAYLFLFVTAILWGVAGPVIKYTLEGITPLSFLSYRFAISAGLAVVFLYITKFSLPKSRSTLIMMITYALLSSSISLGLLFLGLEKTSVLDLVLLAALGPLLTVSFGVIFLKEHITKQEKIGISIAFIGVLLANFLPAILNGEKIIKLSGNLLILLSMLAGTSSSVLVKKLVRRKVNPIDLTNFAFVIGFATMFPIVIFSFGFDNFIKEIITLSLPHHLGVWYMAILSGTFAYWLWIKGQKTIEISEAALFAYLQPLFATPLAVIWLGEEITATFIIGAVIIATGVTIAERKQSLRFDNLKKKR